jgi:TonB-linked SusC/RagA family outer membrane protein
MRKSLLLSLVLLLLMGTSAWAQRTVTGMVTDAGNGDGLPGVAVRVKNTSQGTVTDMDGNYRIDLPAGNVTLVFSFVGYANREVAVGNQSVINVQLAEDVEQLSEVVVTAVGIRREQKALGYAVERVAGEQLQQVAEPDPLRALQGKVAGVNIGGSSGAPGSSTRITIRGNSSMLGDNQPLFVVDGIPFNNDANATFSGLQQGTANTSRIADLDPNNIESMTVLKGAAAAALYGTRAANGVILITTKTGGGGISRKGLEITYTTSYSWETIANLPDYQNVYGTGVNFNYQQVNGSWGAPFIGARPYALVDSIPHWYAANPGMEQFAGILVPYRAYPNNVRDLFRTGHIFDNSISIQGGTDRSSIGLTVSHTDHEGYVPNTEFERTTVGVGGRTTLENGLSMGANLLYSRINQRAVQAGVGNSGANNPSAFARALYLGRNWDVQGQPYQNPIDFGSEFMVGRGQADNPYWSYENAGSRERTDRIMGTVDLGYDLTSWLNATYKIGINSYNQRNLDFIRPGSTGPSSNPGAGQITEDYISFEEIESNFLLTADYDFSEDISIRTTLGQNMNQRTRRRQAFQGLNYVVFDIDDIDNTNDVTPAGGGYSQRRIIGVFADATIGYRDWAYLSLTARNDWSSTLPQGNNSFFYPAASLSVILTDALNIRGGAVDYLKLRAGVAQVGNDTDPYQLRPVYIVNPVGGILQPAGGAIFPFRGVPGATLENTQYDPNLKPERTREVELGLDARLFDNRFGIEFSVYDKRSFDQIANITLPAVTGYSSLLTNFGTVKNRGVELGLDITPIRTNDFRWNMYATFTHNRNTIEELTDLVPQIEFGAGFAGGVRSVHRAGQEYGLLLGSVSARDQDGNLLINPANGELIRENELRIIGNPNPDFVAGLINTFSYKGIRLSGVIDWRQGGDLWSNTVLSLLGRGVTRDTEDREQNYIIPGVYGDPVTLEPIRNPETGEKYPNQTQIDMNSLWFGETFAINAADEWAVWDATTFRLREVSLGYDLPAKWLEATPVGSVSLSFTGRNLWFRAPNFPRHTNFDPEVNQFGNSNQQGIEWSATPTTKRYSLNLKVTF